MIENCKKNNDSNLNTFERRKLNEGELLFSARKLRLLGLLWCDGDSKEKAEEFYDII